MQHKFALFFGGCGDFGIHVVDLFLVDLHAAALDEPARLALGFRRLRRDQNVCSRRR